MTTKFKAGDKVRVLNSCGGASYRIGEVLTVSRVSYGNGRDYDFIYCAGKGGEGMYAHRFELVPFKLEIGKTYKTRHGLKVGPLRANTGTYNTTYPFVAVDPDGDETAWLSNGGYLRSEPGHKFDLVAEWVEPAVPATPAAPAFNVGDKVRFTAACEPCWWFKKGQTGEVIETNRRSGYSFSVKVDGAAVKQPAFVSAKHIELIAPAVPTGPFKVGDRVVCTDFGGDRYGLKGITGTVTNPKNYESVLVTWDAPFNGHGPSRRDWNVNPAHLRLVTEADKPGSFIVVNVAPNGKLAAAANPFIHATQQDAEKEALRLSEVVRGQDFRVYSFNHLSTAKAEKPLPAPAGKLVAVGASL